MKLTNKKKMTYEQLQQLAIEYLAQAFEGNYRQAHVVQAAVVILATVKPKS